MDTSATAKRTEQRLKKTRGRNGLINRVLRIECLGPTFVFHYRRDHYPIHFPASFPAPLSHTSLPWHRPKFLEVRTLALLQSTAGITTGTSKTRGRPHQH
jgi:hypothetical protein